MALYEVVRVDDVEPGGFENALVIAGGVAQARAQVAHLVPKGAQLLASRVELTKVLPKLLHVYFNEQDPTPPFGAEVPGQLTIDEYAGDVSAPGSFNW